MFTVIALSAVVAANPVHEAIDAATRDPELRAELRRVCLRESRCRPVHRHPSDSWAGRAMWEDGVARGMLHPEACPEHEASPGAGEWAPRGPFGVSPVYLVRFLGACVPPQATDEPTRAARAVVAWVRHLRRRGVARTCEERAAVWAGLGTFARRSPWRQLETIETQCGPASPLRWAGALAATVARARLEPLREAARALVERITTWTKTNTTRVRATATSRSGLPWRSWPPYGQEAPTWTPSTTPGAKGPRSGAPRSI